MSTGARWAIGAHVRGIVDLTMPRPDGTIVIAARGRLLSLRLGETAAPFAPAYSAPPGLEPYLVLAGRAPAGDRCPFAPGTAYALRLRGGDGVTSISPAGRVRRFAALPSAGLENGIALDTTGRFGYRLLVSAAGRSSATVYAIDCRGHVQTVTAAAPKVEGGLAVAPRGFGRFAGDLIAPDEHDGMVYAISPNGETTLVARSGLPHGQDIGVESLGFVPARFKQALVSDRGTRNNRHLGDDAILTVGRQALAAAGVRAGDLLAVAEGGALTIDIRCAASCSVRRVALGPSRAHVEGHIVFSRG
ncbi:MAG: hypothetical protein ACYCXW_01370 [Solirubrobacteraceae bacterium]